MKKFLFAFGMAALVACTPSKERSAELIKGTVEKVQSAFDSARTDTTNIKLAIEYIEGYVQKYPEDSLSPKFMFYLASIYQRQNRYDLALINFDSIFIKYPRSKEAAQAVFNMGFIYNEMGTLDRAKEKYQLYIDRYGDRDAKMTEDARLEIERLGMTPDEIVKMFEEKAAEDSAKASN